MRRTIPLGLLYSITGTYGALGQDLLDGSTMAVEDVNNDDGCSFRFDPIHEDPAGEIENYHRMSEHMLRAGQCRHVLGTITSIARKEVIPIIEKHDGLLWYSVPYEGFEVCDNVIYTGGAPNQHVLPLFAHMLSKFGNRVYLTGSNYVWGWEVNRIARELVTATGGEIVGERYLAIGDVGVSRMVAEIEQKRPDFVLNNLIGTSSYAFLKAYHDLSLRNADFLPENRPVTSCDLTECELAEIGPEAAQGHICSAVYFENVDNAMNRAFRSKVTDRFGADRPLSAFMVGAFEAVHMLAGAITMAMTDDIEPVKQALYSHVFDTAMGPVSINSKTNHAALTPYLGRINDRMEFDIIEQANSAVPADPYLVNFDARRFAEQVITARKRNLANHLRVVS